MKTYINELLQETLNMNKDFTELSETIYNYIIKNDEDKYNYIVDAMQIAILQQAEKLLMYSECEDMYFAIKGFQSII